MMEARVVTSRSDGPRPSAARPEAAIALDHRLQNRVQRYSGRESISVGKEVALEGRARQIEVIGCIGIRDPSRNVLERKLGELRDPGSDLIQRVSFRNRHWYGDHPSGHQVVEERHPADVQGHAILARTNATIVPADSSE